MERPPSWRRPRAMVCLKSRSAPATSRAARADLADSYVFLRRVPGSSADRVVAPKNAQKAKSSTHLEPQFSTEWNLVATVCRSTGWRRQWLAVADSRSFDNGVNGVGRHIFKSFHFPGGP